MAWSRDPWVQPTKSSSDVWGAIAIAWLFITMFHLMAYVSSMMAMANRGGAVISSLDWGISQDSYPRLMNQFHES